MATVIENVRGIAALCLVSFNFGGWLLLSGLLEGSTAVAWRLLDSAVSRRKRRSLVAHI